MLTSPRAAAPPEVTVIVPMYNESATIAQNVEQLVSACEHLGSTWELVLVNDGSTDGTGDRVQRLAQRDARIRPISYGKNRGRGYALRRGFAVAQGDVVVTTEADLTYGTAILEQLIHTLDREGVEIAIASPYLAGGQLEGVPWHRAWLSRYGNRVLRLALGSRTATVSGMTRAYTRSVLDALDLESEGKEIHLEILSKAFTLGFRSCDVPATLRWDAARRKSRSNAATFRALPLIMSHLLFSFAEFPFLLMGTVAMGLLGAGLAAGLYALWLSAQGIPVGNRPLTLGAVMCVLSSIQLLMFSFLAHQVREVKRQLVRLHGRLRIAHRTDSREESYVG